jgi:hypothetical protein
MSLHQSGGVVVITAFKTYGSWESARLYALAIIVVVIALLFGASVIGRKRGATHGGLLNGADNRWSTSKVSVFLWTFAILWAFTSVLLRYGGTAVPSSVPAEYFVLLGIPAAGALGAKAITKGQADAGAKTSLPESTLNPVKGVGQIFSDDTGTPDLLDSQYFLFNCLLLGYFLAGFFQIADPKGASTDIILPTLPGSLLALAGISTATYLGKKGLGEASGTTIPSGSSVQLPEDSDVSLPGGGTISLKSAGVVTIFPGVTYTSKSGGDRESATGGRITTTVDSRVRLDQGATITALLASTINAVNASKLLVSAGSTIVDANGAPIADAGGGGTDVNAGAVVTLATAGRVVVMTDAAELELRAGTTIEYSGGGTAIVLGQTLEGTLTAGATLAQLGIDDATFPDGLNYVAAPTAGPLQHVGPGETITLQVAAAGNPEKSITIIDDARVKLPTSTKIAFPAAPTAVGAGVETTAATKTTLNLPSGGDVVIKAAGSTVSVRAPAGSVVTVPADADAATVTPAS